MLVLSMSLMRRQIRKVKEKAKEQKKKIFFLGGLLLVIILSFYKIGFFLKFSKEGENV